jgi:hypothetical protein
MLTQSWSHLDALASVLASETSDLAAKYAVGLTVLTVFRGRPADRLRPSTSQGGNQRYSTRRPGGDLDYRVAADVIAMWNEGVTFHSATSCFEWFEQERLHRRDPSKYKSPEQVHVSWIHGGEQVAAVYRGWVFYRRRT